MESRNHNLRLAMWLCSKQPFPHKNPFPQTPALRRGQSAEKKKSG